MKDKACPFRIAEKIVAYEHSVMQYNLPAVMAANGDILTGFTTAVDQCPGAEVFHLRSTDMGRTYELTGLPMGPMEVEHAGGGGARLRLPDGALFGLRNDVHIPRHSEDAHYRHMKNQRDKTTRVFTLRSDEHGHHWRVLNEIFTPDFSTFHICDGVVMDDGELILFAYGTLKKELESLGAGKSVPRIALIHSRDGGRTFGEAQTIHDGSPPLNEISVAKCPDGSLLAVCRQGGTLPLMAFESADGGAAWTKPRETPMRGECLDVAVTPGGRVLVAYRQTTGKGGFGCACYWSDDLGRSWDGPLMLQDPKGRVHEWFHETGGQSILPLPDGTIYVLYYSYDPDLPFTHPLNDRLWQEVAHFWKRYIAANVLEES